LTHDSAFSTRCAKISDLAAVLCYPRPELGELESRITELASLGVDAIELSGAKTIGRVNVLGKGCVGIVVKARIGKEELALKIRRTDADRQDMRHEAEMLRLANSVGVGPRLVSHSKNFLLMEFIDGLPVGSWVERLPKRGSRRRVRRVVERLLDDCFSLDEIHVDHGELSDAHKNVLIDETDNPRIVDFETASNTRRASNVTSIGQYLLIGGGPARWLRGILGSQKKATLHALRRYKRESNLENLRKIKTAACLKHVTKR
jgi:putative serine/threonine protein kinase